MEKKAGNLDELGSGGWKLDWEQDRSLMLCTLYSSPKYVDYMTIRLKRAYDDPDTSDGYRVLVDRLWPRGISKEVLQGDEWLKEIAPSDELRKRFDHDPEKFDDFKEKYYAELDQKPDLVDHLLKKIHSGQTLTLVYAAKDREHNNAVLLKKYLENRLG